MYLHAVNTINIVKFQLMPRRRGKYVSRHLFDFTNFS